MIRPALAAGVEQRLLGGRQRVVARRMVALRAVAVEAGGGEVVRLVVAGTARPPAPWHDVVGVEEVVAQLAILAPVLRTRVYVLSRRVGKGHAPLPVAGTRPSHRLPQPPPRQDA